MRNILLILITISCASCATKYVKFNQIQNEIQTTKKLSEFLKKNKNPKIVLRTPIASKKMTEKENVSSLYNAIEKEFLSQGFIVRDRNLFNQVVGNNRNTVNYSKLKDETDTDLIIELLKVDEILYETNKYNIDKGKSGILNTPYKQFGAAVEFKVVLISNNEFAGTYKFNYTPCINDNECVINKSWGKRVKKIKRGKGSYEKVSYNAMEKFIRNATKKLVVEMRK